MAASQVPREFKMDFHKVISWIHKIIQISKITIYRFNKSFQKSFFNIENMII